MDRKRQLTLVFSLIGIALGVGHIVQNGAESPGTAAAATQPTNVDFVSASTDGTASNGTSEATVPVLADLSPPEPAIPPKTNLMLISPAPAQSPIIAAPETDLVVPVQPQAAEPQPIAPQAVSNDPVAPVAPPARLETSAPPIIVGEAGPDATAPLMTATPSRPNPVQSTPVPATPAAEAVDAACPITIKVALAPQAMIGVSILAPCAPDARVVVEHEGLTITQKTDAAGSVFLSMPALAVDATVTATVAGADAVSESLRIPAMTTLRRFGVQWQDKDAFQLHAFENGADYGGTGHLSATDPHTPLTGAPPAGGYVTLLGAADVTLPMLAEIYTFPADGTANNGVLVESVVTEATCGREMRGETIMTVAGEAYVTELTLAMPDCDGLGDILVLKNLVTDLTIAAAN